MQVMTLKQIHFMISVITVIILCYYFYLQQFNLTMDKNLSNIRLKLLLWQSNIANYKSVCQLNEKLSSSSSSSTLNIHQHEYHHSTNFTNVNSNHYDYVQFSNYFDQSTSIANLTESIFLFNAYAKVSETLVKNKFNTKLQEYSIVIISIVNRSQYCDENVIDDSSLSNTLMNNTELVCKFNHNSIKSMAKLNCLPEHHNYNYTAALIVCPMTKSIEQIDRIDFVSIELMNTNDIQIIASSDSLPIQFPHKEGTPASVVCIRPLFGSINIVNLLEFIFYYRMNGFDRLIFYHYDYNLSQISSNNINNNGLKNFRQLIASLNFVELKLFTLTKELYENINSGGQLVTINDCLYSYPNSFQLHVDIDEFVYINLDGQSRIINAIVGWYYSKLSYASITISNVFHCHEMNIAHSNYYEFSLFRHRYLFNKCNNQSCTPPNSTMDRWENFHWLKDQFKDAEFNNDKENIIQSILLVPNSNICQKTIWSQPYRSKVIILRPWLIEQMGIHQVWLYVDQSIVNANRNNALVANNRFFLQDNFLNHYLSNLFLLPIHLFGKIWPKIFLNNSKQEYTSNDFWPLLIISNKNMNKHEALVRHFRWCCHLEQNYFFQLANFYSLEDNFIQCFSKVNFSLPNNFWRLIGENVIDHFF